MSWLESAPAQRLLQETEMPVPAVASCGARLNRFLARYAPLFYREEQRANARIVVAGLLGDLERKTCEPIARRNGLHRKPIQFFVGNGKWDDEAVLDELFRHVLECRADPHGIVVFDGSAFPKKGTASCGVKRQWCGRLGKVDNCQNAVFMAYATPAGYAPLDRRLYLPEDWAGDAKRREHTHVPVSVVFRTKWQIALDMLDARGAIPHAWITGDDEFGRVCEFRSDLRRRGEAYVLDVPCNTQIRDLETAPPARRKSRGRPPARPWLSVNAWMNLQPASRWQTFSIRDGTKGPLQVRALSTRVQTGSEKGVAVEERLIVFKTVEAHPRTVYALAHGPHSGHKGGASLDELLRVAAARHRVEEMFEAAKGEAGLGHYEVRSWIGWHHHVTLSLLALWFLILERERLGKKMSRIDGATNAPTLLAPAAQTA